MRAISTRPSTAPASRAEERYLSLSIYSKSSRRCWARLKMDLLSFGLYLSRNGMTSRLTTFLKYLSSRFELSILYSMPYDLR